MMLVRILKWMAAVLMALVLLAVSFVVIFGWNWMRAPIERMTLEKTGRELHIGGDIGLTLAWPRPHLHTGAVTFANPPWAKNPQKLSAEAVDITLDLPQLLRKNMVFPEVRVDRPRVFLEQGSEARKSWLLDRNQKDESAVIQIGRLTLNQGTLSYDDPAQKTSIQSELSTSQAPADAGSGPGVTFSAVGRYKGLPLKATGSGGSVLALRFDEQPYPLKIDGTVGRTSVRADGSITSLLKFSAVDMRLALRGDSLDQLYPLLGIALPATRAYAVDGQLRHSGKQWQFEKFSGRIGASDIAGTLGVDVGGKRPALVAELNSKLLDIADLGPLIGARPGKIEVAKQAAPAPAAALAPPPTPAPTPRAARVLPDVPFKTERWNTVDAEVTLRAATLRRAKDLPLEGLVTHLSLRDSVLTLDPLNFGLAGGQLNAVISLDGRQDPIQAKARVRALRVQVGKLLPSFDLTKTGIGQISGEFNLAGKGNSVGRMLATADGKVGLVVAGGKVSRLMMEMAGLHLWEILQLTIAGDRQINLRCAVADFDVKQGILSTDALVFDTEVTTIIGTGTIDLGRETIDLTLNQKTKTTSPLALRSPIYIRGSFVKPTVGVDKGRVAVRALGALGLSLINPFLTLLPLIDAGPGQDSDCGQLVREARAAPAEQKKAGTPK